MSQRSERDLRIITPVETQRLRAKLKDPERRTNRAARRYLLALDELAELWAAGTIGRSEWLKARGPIEKRQSQSKIRLAALNRTTALTPHLGDADGLREKWAEMNLTRQQQIVGALLDHVVVGPARRGYNRFDPSRLEPVWRV